MKLNVELNISRNEESQWAESLVSSLTIESSIGDIVPKPERNDYITRTSMYTELSNIISNVVKDYIKDINLKEKQLKESISKRFQNHVIPEMKIEQENKESES